MTNKHFIFIINNLKSLNIIDRFRLINKKAMVTGGGRGLGRAYAIALAEAGAEGKGKIVTGQILLLQMTSTQRVAINHGRIL